MPVPFALLKQHRVHRHPILHKFLLLLCVFCFRHECYSSQSHVTKLLCPSVFLSVIYLFFWIIRFYFLVGFTFPKQVF